MKKFEFYKKCVIVTFSGIYTDVFDNSFSFSDIKDWMLETYCIEHDSIVSIEISSVTIYKQKCNG